MYWEIIADNLSKAGWSWGCVATIDSNGRTFWIADAHQLTEGPNAMCRECYHNREKLSTYVPLLTADGVMPDLKAIAFSTLVTSLAVPAVILALAPLDIMVPWVGVGVVLSFV
jgi:hypothetical protein